MGRWGELATQIHGEAGDERPPSIEEFLESNHQLFTVIGIFGALSVYLIKFQQSAAETGAATGSVGAILLLFLLTSSVAVRNSYRCTERARRHGAYLLVFGYAVFMYSFVTLVVSVVLVIVGRYAQGAESVLGSSFVYALVFLYVPFIFRADAFREFEGSSVAAAGVRRAPHFGAVVLAAWYAMQWYRGTPPALELDSAAYSIGIVASLVGNHFVLTAFAFGALWVGDRVVTAIRG
ncbi:hypothetical protein M0R89_19310 (plasmid) [Halorussus limi]|uniref:Uncharacterized protein n=1 Tax=Halorussus limi TaxID=2938695 RepID=A0A8U0HZU1_9EURY|nr:hypothetical protein [Halorussus limi]UPV76313.1 hypothetical protein M0R89_19310 [Halorussus limi]